MDAHRSQKEPEFAPQLEDEDSIASRVSMPTLAATIVVCAVLYVGKDLFLPMAIGMLFAFILSPLVTVLRKWTGLGDTAAVITTALAASVSVIAFLGVVTYQLTLIGTNLPTYQGNVLAKIDGLLTTGNDNEVVARMRDMFDKISARLEDAQESAASPPGPSGNEKVMEVAVVERTTFRTIIQSVIMPVVGPVAVFGLIWVIVIFALLERGALRDKMVQLTGGTNIVASSRLLAEAGGRVSQYLLAQLLVNVIYAVPIGIGLWVIGVPNAMFFSLVTLVMRFVPFIGSALSALLPLLMAFAVSPDWSLVLWTGALFLAVELITSNVIEPWFYGQRTGLSSLSIIVAAMFWTWLWGPMGLIMATPLTVCLVVLGNHLPSMRVFSVLLGDKPALEPAKQLYDRLLLGNAFASVDNAAASSSSAYLSEYYDQAAIPALALAQADLSAGLLTEAQAIRIAHGAERLVAEMEAVVEEELAQAAQSPASLDPAGDDVEANAGPDEVLSNGVLDGLGHRILVLGARTGLEDAAAEFIAQAMRAEGAEAIALPHRAVRPSDPSKKPATAIVAAVLSGMEARVLDIRIRQIRRANPSVPVFVSLWGRDDGQMRQTSDAKTAVVRGMGPLLSQIFALDAPQTTSAT